MSYCFSKREGGVLVTADLRTSCYFDTFFKKYFHVRYESDVSISTLGCTVRSESRCGHRHKQICRKCLRIN